MSEPIRITHKIDNSDKWDALFLYDIFGDPPKNAIPYIGELGTIIEKNEQNTIDNIKINIGYNSNVEWFNSPILFEGKDCHNCEILTYLIPEDSTENISETTDESLLQNNTTISWDSSKKGFDPNLNTINITVDRTRIKGILQYEINENYPEGRWITNSDYMILTEEIFEDFDPVTELPITNVIASNIDSGIYNSNYIPPFFGQKSLNLGNDESEEFPELSPPSFGTNQIDFDFRGTSRPIDI